jgi:bifunctional UDP-N-acetylglucosamine pyrophosphorylase / glucosamine-1-phosphate N-acetyltransferase
MTETSSLAIILAAGKGTRMKSALPKVLHKLAGAPMIAHVLDAAQAAGVAKLALVVGPGMEEVAQAATSLDRKLEVFVQPGQLGTADAVKAARQALEDFKGHVLILYGDTPLLRPETLNAVSAELAAGADLVVIGFEAENPTGYGRLLLDDRGRLIAIREEKDASETERALTLCNSGIMGFRSAKTLLGLLGRIGKNNAKGEFYLTDAVALASGDRLETRIVLSSGAEVLGVNSRAELAEAEAAMQQRLRARAMAEGATLIAPETVFLSHDTRIGKDVLIEPHVFIGERVTIADGVTIKAFSHLDGARIGEGATVGPFARLRPGANLAKGAHIGNFVEIKQAEIAEGAKVNHLTYIGDASVGARANIGAGTITCNYDGFAKHRTEIGADAFIGSNSSLVAPVKIGEGAYIGSGSVISKDVEADALALTRAPQEERKGWAARVREQRGRNKAKNGGNKGT